MYFRPVYILILFSTIIIDYFAGIFIYKALTQKIKKRFLVLSLVANIGILAVFKYFNFLNYNLSLIFDAVDQHNPIPYLEILLPIGLSFHTFQAMSYTIEVYRGNQKPEMHFGNYALYVMFYPQLVAGPIERPQNILHQFHEKKYFKYERVVSGLRLMLWGFFKKMVIADNLSTVANNVFNNPNDQNSITFFIGALCFTFQIYCDFSGYSDIAIGSARVMGFELMKNFNIPYAAKSIRDFWNRWHISLSTWFRDYLYIPLGGNRKGEFRKQINVLIVFTVSGLWHGASWNFIIWGALNGCYLIILDLFQRTKLSEKNRNNIIYRTTGALFTFFIVTLTWIFFRVTNVKEAWNAVYTILFGVKNTIAQGSISFSGLMLDNKKYFIALLFLTLIFFITDIFKDTAKVKEIYFKYPIIRYCSYFILLFMIMTLSYVEETPFIYFQF